MTTHPTLDLDSDSVFDHVRASDRELVGYIAITDDDRFVPFDLLHRQVGPAGELDAAEHLLDTIGLTLMAHAYQVQRDGHTVHVGIKELTRTEVVVSPLVGDLLPDGPDVDMTDRWTYPLPTTELVRVER